ncbi:hypothetical protein [Thiothrix subterranea]|uniref:ATP-sulfurylase PUA-like domain-containing protein n=1 Tax=Thiothrix subterranea TaxID=2735563 RepID=A0AA51MP37_9GAMM|nr:hypothetical protein [Thiothrix subterranea]MDQ5767069.1 hypothetical protein [Thiothrix subterranea]WML88069.1 hypothetical protein RCG00_06775 [Thiothrix subterranea]
MSILHKIVNHNEISTLELLLNGAFAPLHGYLNQDDHCSVLQHNRLANGTLWPLPLALSLTPAEKREAQLSGRIVLVDGLERRAIAEVSVESFYRLPADVAELAQAFDANRTPDTWYASGTVKPLQKILHPAFNSLRFNVPALRQNVQEWHSIIAVQAAPTLDSNDLQRACEWLTDTEIGGGLLVQIGINETSPDFHQQVRELRNQVKCTSARQVKLSLLPCIEGLGENRCLLLQALVSRNYGATGFVVGKHISPEARRWLLKHHDELGLDIIPVRAQRPQAAKPTVRHPLCEAA